MNALSVCMCAVPIEARRPHQIHWSWSDMTVSHPVGARNQTQLICKSSQCS